MKLTNNWLAMNGTPGCLPDNADGYETREEAVASLVDILELTDEEEVELSETGIIYFDEDRADEVGAQYCEVCEGDDDFEEE